MKNTPISSNTNGNPAAGAGANGNAGGTGANGGAVAGAGSNVRAQYFSDGGSFPGPGPTGSRGGMTAAHLLGGAAGSYADVLRPVGPLPPPFPKGPLAPSQTPNPDVEVMQNKLIDLGYLEQSQIQGYEGVYGNNTTKAVHEFQLANGIIPPTGIADEATLAAMGGSSAVSEQAYLDGLSGQTVLSQSIGTAGPSPVPTMETLEQGPLTGTITSSQNVNARPSPSTTGEPRGQFAPGTTVTIAEPQPPIPQGGEQGWVYVNGTGTDGKPLSGWVSNGAHGDLVRENDRQGDPRVQDRMEAMGYVPPDGNVDTRAVTNFQVMNGLPATGQLDDATLQAMWSADAKISTHLRQVKDTTYNHSSDAPASSNNCGPTSVAMGLAAVGLRPIDNADPQEAIDQARAAMGGTNSSLTGPGDLEEAIVDAGGQPYRVHNQEELIMAVTQGDPVVVFGNTYGGHWVTVQGYDAATGNFLVSDPMSRDGVAWWTPDQMSAYDNYTVDSVAIHNPNQ